MKYTSSDSTIATVKSTGEIKAIAKGVVTVTVSAGEISKEIEITVKEATLKIEVNSTYVVLKPNDEFKLIASAQPSEASQSLTYKSADKDIATVSSSGTISVKAIGTTSVIISNGDISTAVTVIVNESGISEQTVDENVINNTNSNADSKDQNISGKEAELIEKIKNTTDTEIEIEAMNYQTISTNILKCLYEEKKVLVIKGNDYTIRLDGADIVNYENELITEIEFITENNGTSFIVNENHNLPGAIRLTFNEESYRGKYLYLYNETKEKYQIIINDENSSTSLLIDTVGKYLLTDEKIAVVQVGMVIVIVLSICIIIASVVYIAVKKKYWFW